MAQRRLIMDSSARGKIMLTDSTIVGEAVLNGRGGMYHVCSLIPSGATELDELVRVWRYHRCTHFFFVILVV